MDQDHEMEISDTEVWQSNADQVSTHVEEND